mmetsp:Transcript_112407/g.281596  ORF Transcript_112407/g.281596 Transcript_112407/m.281596 type:complete len:255 (+) Transcript_112407:215-979(+)
MLLPGPAAVAVPVAAAVAAGQKSDPLELLLLQHVPKTRSQCLWHLQAPVLRRQLLLATLVAKEWTMALCLSSALAPGQRRLLRRHRPLPLPSQRSQWSATETSPTASLCLQQRHPEPQQRCPPGGRRRSLMPPSLPASAAAAASGCGPALAAAAASASFSCWRKTPSVSPQTPSGKPPPQSHRPKDPPPPAAAAAVRAAAAVAAVAGGSLRYPPLPLAQQACPTPQHRLHEIQLLLQSPWPRGAAPTGCGRSLG